MDPLDHHYEIAASELSERRCNRGLLARCVAESEGDELKAKARYLSLRAAQLAQIEFERDYGELRKEELRQAKIIEEAERRKNEEEKQSGNGILVFGFLLALVVIIIGFVSL